MSEKREIKVSEVLTMLEEGKSRKEIKTELGISHNEMRQLFKHPQLVGRKAKQPLSFDIVDDVTEPGDVQEETSADVETEEIQDDEFTGSGSFN